MQAPNKSTSKSKAKAGTKAVQPQKQAAASAGASALARSLFNRKSKKGGEAVAAWLSHFFRHILPTCGPLTLQLAVCALQLLSPKSPRQATRCHQLYLMLKRCLVSNLTPCLQMMQFWKLRSELQALLNLVLSTNSHSNLELRPSPPRMEPPHQSPMVSCLAAVHSCMICCRQCYTLFPQHVLPNKCARHCQQSCVINACGC